MAQAERRSSLLIIFGLMALLTGLLPAGAAPATTGSDTPISVIVRASAGQIDTVREAIVSVGGSVTRDLWLIDGLAATMPANQLNSVAGVSGVIAITEDAAIMLHSRRSESTDGPSIAELTTQVLDVDRLWRRGITGEGVGVALIDSGVAPVGGLDAPGKVRNGPDLSFDSPFDNLRYLDMYGHGTHLAGIIAGADPGLGSRPTERAARAHFAGVAPGAHIVNVKVADGQGTADVSQVIAGIQWVVEHKDDPEAAIRVLNLAFGTDGTQDYQIDPLAYAVEQAWHAGLVVVVAAGNDGNDVALRNPATDPFVIAVGATDPDGTRATRDDEVLEFSNCGTRERPVDLVAPGRSIASLRVPGSYIDSQYPEAADGERFFRGTGTSQAAAVASGVAALIIDARPDLTPDEVKALMVGTARPVPEADGACAGVGAVDPLRAATRKPPRHAAQDWPISDGSGSLEAARGSYHVYRDGVALEGEIDITGSEWSGGTM